MRILANTNFNFIRWRWHAFVLSIALIATGIATMVSRGGMALGVDFTGGTVIVVQFAKPTGEEVVRNALSALSGDTVVQRFGSPGDNQIMIRLPILSGTEQGLGLDADAARVEEALKAANVGEFTRVSRDLVGPTIGRDLQRKGIMATVASLVGIMAYIALRFRLSFGVGAMIASIHDVLVTLSLLMLFNYELTLNVVAAILTLTGYGVNDQIVVFDRVRENLRKSRTEPHGFGDQHEREPDAPADHHHGRRDLPCRAGAVSLRWRGARGFCVRDARRDCHEHVLDGLHRVGGRGRPEQTPRRHADGHPGAGEGQAARVSPAARGRWKAEVAG